MSISFPLALPTTRAPAKIEISGSSVVGLSQSPFTGAQQTYVWPGDSWRARLSLGQMTRADAEYWIAFLLSLNGMEGSFLFGDPLGTSPRGSWVGSPLVNGAHAARARTIALDGFTPSATGVVKAGDWVQFSSGASTRLHKALVDADANGSGQVTLEIWPSLRAALADNAVLVTSSAKGLWMLATNERGWSVEDVRLGSIEVQCVEDLRAL